MRAIAGSLKLELAQFREVEAFSSFASDLDENTQNTLNRGNRLIELLKQGQFKPLPVEIQIGLIYAGMRGFLDELSVAKISHFEKLFKEQIVNNSNLLNELKVNNDFTDTLNTNLTEFIQNIINSIK